METSRREHEAIMRDKQISMEKSKDQIRNFMGITQFNEIYKFLTYYRS